MVVSAAENLKPVEIDPSSLRAEVTMGGETQTLTPTGTPTSPEGKTKRTAVLVLDTSRHLDAIGEIDTETRRVSRSGLRWPRLRRGGGGAGRSSRVRRRPWR